MNDLSDINKEQAPIEFIRDYYNKRIERRNLFPEALDFYKNQLKNVFGGRVINIGCGPQFYDDVRYFSEMPKEYIGLDLNSQNFNFMKYSNNPELLKGRRLVKDSGIKVEFICGDIFEPELKEHSSLLNADSVISVGFLGVFEEKKFKKAICRIGNWLGEKGRLVNLSWCGNHQEKQLYEGRLKHRFNYKKNVDHEEILRFAQEAGLFLVKENLFKVSNKTAYGWSAISASVFKKPS